jgi:very-short-patch-repair endonuclease
MANSPTDQVLAYLMNWKKKLLNVGRRNKLINYRMTKTASIEIVAPESEEILSRLLLGRKWEFYIPPRKPDDATEEELNKWRLSWPKRKTKQARIHHEERKRTRSAIRTLRRKSLNAINDMGFHVLYLAYGFLNWQEPTEQGGKKNVSPLFLFELTIDVPPGEKPSTFYLHEEDWKFNPSLLRHLQQDYGVDIDSILDHDIEDPSHFFATIEERVRIALPKSSVSDEVRLDIFQFSKEAIYRDLNENSAIIAEHDFIQSMCGVEDAAERLDFTEPDIERLDETNPPENMHNILDADSSQLACVVACAEGRSFVMDGPPGTGKSQTIANMIAELLAEGKKVLFVSEKAAALEVVQNRLTSRGLHHYALPLHSESATRKNFVDELYNALNFHPEVKFDKLSIRKLKSTRKALSDHVLEMNRHHEEVESTLFIMIGRAISLQHIPLLPALDDDSIEITSESIESVRECADQIIDQWKIHSKGSDYSWFGFNRKSIGAGERFEVNEILNNLSSRTSDLQDNLTISSKEIHVVAPNTKEDGWAIIEHLNTINNCGKINYLVFTPEGYTEIKSTYDRLKECHLEINRLTSESPFHITNSHLEFTIDEIIALHSSVEYVMSAPFFPTDYYVLITGDSLNLWINGSKSIDQALARLVEISGVFEEEWPSLTSLKKKSFDDLSILSRHFGDRSEPPFSWLKPGQSTVLQQLAADCISQVTEFREAEQALLQKYNQNVLSKGFVQASSVIVDMREKWWRMFSSSYRKAKKFVKTTSKTNEFPTNQDLSFATNLNQEMDRLTRMFDSEWKVIVNKTSLSNFDLNLIEKRIDCLKTIDELRSQGLSSQDLAKLYSDGPIQLRLLDALHQSMIENESIDAELLKSKPLKLGASVNWKISTIEKNWNEFYTHLMDLKQFIDKCEHNFTGIDIEGLKKGLLSIEGIQNNRNCINEILNDTHIKLDGFYESDTTDWHLKDEYLKQINGLLEYQENPFTEGEVQIIIHTALKMSENCESALKSFEEGMKTYSKFFDEHRREPLFDLRFDNLMDMINVQLNEIDTLDGYLRLKQEIVEAENLGLSSLLETFTERCIDKALLPDAFERALLNKWIEYQLGKEFNGFDSSSHERERELFIELDKSILDSKCATIMESCNERRPKHRLAFAAKINREHEKKRRHLPIRTLIADGMDFILSLKPCVMMSPLSVSHFLPAQKDLFDVVIFDEASQVRPEEAINCIYRGKQTIVVGDQKQLPPTDFFSRSIDDDDDDDEVDDFDSVLDIAKAGAGIRSLSLMWHYRSQHEDLITFSNHRFYDSRLFTFPSAMEEHDRLGISLTKVDGIYDRGGSRTNLIEAEAVYNKIKDLVTSEPDLTIGVVAFSSAQMGAIDAEIEKRRQHDPVMDEWFSSHETRLDGFFVKNLENVQGDERDIIIFSTGYGKDQNDKFTNNFGPVGKNLGWRRLNVAITRARRRLEVITSIEAGWIKPTSEAVRHFKKFLEYAEHGPSILEIDLTDSLGDAESPFEEEVIRTIQSWGYEVVPQVGCASYRIDLGVRHPTRKGTYCLAIECDGAMYHSSKVARDRDRIRQQVLERLGWRIHRIWGPTWYNERKVAEDALKVALEEASSKGPLQIFRKEKNEQESFVVTVNEIDETNLKDIVSDYEVTSLQSSWKGKDGFYEHWEKSTIAQQIEKVIKKESPIHFELMVHRIRDAWRFKSASKKMTERTMNIFNQSVNKSGITKDQNGFIWSSSKHSMVKARGPSRNGEARNAKHVPMEEIILVFKELKLMSRDTITKDEMYKRTAELFGWTRRGAVVNKRLEASLRKMKRD